MRPRVYVTRLLPEGPMERILSSCDANVWEGELPPSRSVLLDNTRDAEGLLCLLTDTIDKGVLTNAKNLRVISNLAVGYDNIDLIEAKRLGIVVGNTPGVLTETTADYAFSLLLAASRRIVEADKSVRAGTWKTWGPLTFLGHDMHDATLGILGMGRIGAALAKRARGFNMKVIYHDVKRSKNTENETGAVYVSLETLLSMSDFISIHVNLTDQTRHMIGKKELQMMKQNCVLVNTSRGPIVDNMALYEALREKKIFAAALDVTEPEPIPKNHPLLALDNVIVTPHIASASYHTREDMANIAVDNLLAGLTGQELPHPV